QELYAFDDTTSAKSSAEHRNSRAPSGKMRVLFFFIGIPCGARRSGAPKKSNGISQNLRTLRDAPCRGKVDAYGLRERISARRPSPKPNELTGTGSSRHTRRRSHHATDFYP